MFDFFKKNKEPKDLKGILNQIRDLEKKIEIISEGLENLKKEAKFSVQKTGIVRYNPFSDVGGDQSFSIALLDGNNNGIVVSSLYTKEGNRIYGKPIKNGISEYSLSDEEKKAISKAINNHVPNS